MYSKNTLAVVGLLAAGVMGQSSAPFPLTTSTAVVDPTPAMGHIHGNGTMATPVWSYFNVTVTSVVVVQELTTLCPEATTLTFNDCKYPATAGQVVVVTNCPCTVTKAIPTLTSSLCPPETGKPGLPPPVSRTTPASLPTPTRVVPVEKPTQTAIQVGGASRNTAGFAVAAVAAVAGLF
ncbi:hypothetical protein F4803DRAFT_160564 [Xylaria telfairii]|nr:hypothetical protein F4803DRAFT_160564 [Xylaria telfairii]